MIPRIAPHSHAWLIQAELLVPNLTEEQVGNLARYRDLVLQANQQINLTAIRDSDGLDYRLVLESLRLAPLVRDEMDQAAMNRPRLVDIGSGAGIPGLPLAIVMPDVEIRMIDATGKKARFIEQAISELALTNASVEHGRSEELARNPDWRERYQLATARAVGSVATLLELSMPFLVAGGCAMFPKGELDKRQMRSAGQAANLLGAQLRGIVDSEPIEGCPTTQVVLVDKIAPIADRYPRRPGLPARDPLGG